MQARPGTSGYIIAAGPDLDERFAAVVFGRDPFERRVQGAVDGVADELESGDMRDPQPRARLRPIDAVGEDGVAPVALIDKANQPFRGVLVLGPAHVIGP